jgi:hypothetical protein
MQRSSHLHESLTEAQLDGRDCIRCGDEYSNKRPVMAWTDSARLVECVDVEMCARRISQLRLMGIEVISAVAE